MRIDLGAMPELSPPRVQSESGLIPLSDLTLNSSETLVSSGSEGGTAESLNFTVSAYLVVERGIETFNLWQAE